MATGLSLKEHPVRFFRDRLTRLGAIRNAEHRSEDLRAGPAGHRRRPRAGAADAGHRQGRRLHDARGRDRHRQHHRLAEGACEQNRRTVMTARFLAVRGRLQRAGLVIHVVAESFVDLSEELQRLRDGDLFAPSVPESALPDLTLLKSRDFH